LNQCAELNTLIFYHFHFQPHMPTPSDNPLALSDQDGQRVLKRRLRMLVLILVGLVALAVAWSWSPLRDWLDADRIVSGLQHLGQSMGPLAATLGFACALALAVPLTFLTLVAIVAFGPWAGFCYIMAAAALGSSVSFLIGKYLGHAALVRLAGPKANAVSQRLGNHGILAVIAIRMVPIAPFAVVNMIAGASHLRWRDLVIGTVLGMAPGTLVMMLFIDRIVDALKNPGPTTLLLGALMLGLIVGGLWGARKWVAYVESKSTPP
jgi:uncharacterized membrane protein YdjX (TVP38/TMEM64 family)